MNPIIRVVDESTGERVDPDMIIFGRERTLVQVPKKDKLMYLFSQTYRETYKLFEKLSRLPLRETNKPDGYSCPNCRGELELKSVEPYNQLSKKSRWVCKNCSKGIIILSPVRMVSK